MCDWKSEIDREDYSITVFHPAGPINPQNDDIDIEVRLTNGRRYVATVATLEHLRSVMDSHRDKTGESAFGTYTWCKDLIILREITLDTIEVSVIDLLQTGDIEIAMSRCDEDGDELEKAGRSP